MTATYWTARLIEDPFKNEPRNVGVIVRLRDLFAARFVGERDDGVFDARLTRGFTHPAVYAQWRTFWRRKIAARDIEAITRGNSPNYLVAPGGEVTDTASDNAAEVCHFLYGLLVGKGPVEAYAWDDAEAIEMDLASEIASALAQNAL